MEGSRVTRSDQELVAVFDAAWNAAEDGTRRIPELEAVGLRAVYDAGRTDA